MLSILHCKNIAPVLDTKIFEYMYFMMVSDCKIYEIYILDRRKGTCDIIPSMTEYMVLYPEICYNRCLDNENCRGVSYSPATEICYYHTCDCHTGRDTISGDVFMWKYCLDGKNTSVA